MKVRAVKPSGLAYAAPALALLLLCGLPTVFPNRTITDPTMRTRQQSVALAIENAPYRIGQWIGKDIEVPPAATKLLRPNAILSRHYRRMSDDLELDLLLVHCSDARDMGGHHPPICYPSSGWSAMHPGTDRETNLTVAGQAIPVSVYEFRRMEDDLREVRVRIFNVFILPNGELTTDIGRVNRLRERLAFATAGIAQLQVVTSADLDEERAIPAAGEILTGISEILTELRVLNGGDNVRENR